MIYHVVAVSKNGVIGKDNKLPWHFSVDLKFFKNLTTGHTVIMGRKTFESIVSRLGKPLPNRTNIVLSRKGKMGIHSSILIKEDWFAVESIDKALELVPKGQKAFIIGGAEIYKQTIGKTAGIYQTLIHQNFEGDAFYPGVPADFNEISREKLQDSPLIEAIFYQRKNS